MRDEVKRFRAEGGFLADDFAEKQILEIRKQVGSSKVLLGLSGGVDSSVCAALLAKAIPGQVVCIFVDHGFMRKNEGDEIESVFSKHPLKFVRINAQDRFLEKLKGVIDPEQKRKIIGNEFVKVFEEQAKFYDDIEYLAQGTIYADVVESGKNGATTVKSHHNVGGLPAKMSFKGLVEPLCDLYKEEVRALGRHLSLPGYLVNRQPFPGPGLAVRVIGELTRKKLDILREADAIMREEIKKSRVKASQYFAILTGLRSVGVTSESRTYGYTIALRAISTENFMTCEFVRIPYSLLLRISARITSEVAEVNRVVYDITNKPPATVEWE